MALTKHLGFQVLLCFESLGDFFIFFYIWLLYLEHTVVYSPFLYVCWGYGEKAGMNGMISLDIK